MRLPSLLRPTRKLWREGDVEASSSFSPCCALNASAGLDAHSCTASVFPESRMHNERCHVRFGGRASEPDGSNATWR